VLTPPITLDGSGSANISLTIPPGGIRLVQVVGVNDTILCQGNLDGEGDPNNSGNGRIFEVGRAVLLDLFGDRSFGVSMDWPTGATLDDQLKRSQRTVDCGGNCGLISNIAPVPSPTPAVIGVNAASGRVAFRVPTVPGKYLKKVGLYIYASTNATPATVNATINVYEVATGGDIASAALTAFGQSVNLDHTASFRYVDFAISNATGQYLQMQSGKDYWIQVTSTDADAGPPAKYIKLGYNGGSANAGVRFFSYGTWSDMSAADVPIQLSGCDN
jgi:hypothetical protein